MNKLVLLFIILSNCLCYSQNRDNSDKSIDSTNFDTIYPFALRGEMDEVFSFLDSSKDENLNIAQQKTKQKYYDRFITRSEDFEFNTSNPVMIDMFNRYQNYWRSILIEKVDQDLADKLFFNEMMLFLKREHDLSQTIDEIKPKYYPLFQEFFKAKGFHGLAMGKTDHLFDLYLWQNEEETVYDIELPETEVKVPVVFMKDFISFGWSYYTTFGYSSTGGWVGVDKIYCVKEAYDISSEQFRISYIAHEGQHFVDIKAYPKLKQADLEYRAKLTELALAEKSLIKVIEKFITNAKNDKSNAHAYSNYLVIHELSKTFFNINYVSDIDKWKGVSIKKINNFGAKKLKAHTLILNKKGAETVESCIL